MQLIDILKTLRDHIPQEDFEDVVYTIDSYGDQPEDCILEHGVEWLRGFSISHPFTTDESGFEKLRNI